MTIFEKTRKNIINLKNEADLTFLQLNTIVTNLMALGVNDPQLLNVRWVKDSNTGNEVIFCTYNNFSRGDWWKEKCTIPSDWL